MISSQSADLQQKIEEWEKLKSSQKLKQKLYKKYWHENFQLANTKLKTPRGHISPYDAYFKKYSNIVGWDWRLIAAVAHTESRFNSELVSWAGAVGVMQLMPTTAIKMGLDTAHFFDAELNVKAGINYLSRLDRNFRASVPDENERIKFVLASYNAGPAHILDAIALAKKYEKDATKWEEVEYFLKKKNEPKYYNDPVVKYGSYRGASAAGFVQKILNLYRNYK
jgi:membrane-bound lytic murein transglycosylase F